MRTRSRSRSADRTRIKESSLTISLWAYAELFGLDTPWSEDFENGSLYGTVRAKDPFVASS